MDYKKVIGNKETRFKILKVLKFIPDKIMINIQYRIKLGRKVNIKNPQRFTEKLQWYKCNYRTETMTQCSDKYMVREYVKSKGLENILNKLYQVYESVDEIKLDTLPDKFVVKTTNGSGTNLFCTDKSKFDLKNNKKQLSEWLTRDIYSAGREWSYKNIKARIIVEELLEDDFNNFTGINDYKFFCFNGEPKYVVLDVDRYREHKRNIYDVDWNYIDVSTDYESFGDVVQKPNGFEEMLETAKKLSEDFPFVRVDLYWVNDRVYFGEMTFYPWSGYVQFKPDEFDFILGKKFKLPKATK